MDNREITTIYYKIYYTSQNKQQFLWTEDKLMVRPMVENIIQRGYQFDYIAQVMSKTIVKEQRLELVM